MARKIPIQREGGTVWLWGVDAAHVVGEAAVSAWKEGDGPIAAPAPAEPPATAKRSAKVRPRKRDDVRKIEPADD